jgi:hypothetical protein
MWPPTAPVVGGILGDIGAHARNVFGAAQVTSDLAWKSTHSGDEMNCFFLQQVSLSCLGGLEE